MPISAGGALQGMLRSRAPRFILPTAATCKVPKGTIRTARQKIRIWKRSAFIVVRGMEFFNSTDLTNGYEKNVDFI